MSAGNDPGRRPATAALLDREEDVAAVRSLLGRAAEDRGGLMLVEGAPGVGKTALLDEGARHAGEAGFRVLRARGHELERSHAWGLIRTLLEAPVLDGPSPLPLTGPAAPAAVVFGAGRAHAAPESWFAIAHALYRVVARLAEAAPLLLVLDDAHWADEPSLGFVMYLGTRLADHPVAVLAGARPGEGPEAERLDLLAADSATAVRRLGPLGDAAVATLVRMRHPEAEAALCRRCAELTGGNPFEVHELLAAVEDRAFDAEALDAAAAHAAGSLGRRALQRLAARSSAAQAVARAVAVLEPLAEPGLVLELSDLTPDALLDAVDELEAAQVIRPGDTLSFAHPLLRAAVYGTLSYGERARSHRAAARLLSGRGASPERVGAHLLECLPTGDPAVVDVLREAARRAQEQGAPAAAARYLDRALREPPAGDMHTTVLVELGRAEARSGSPQAPARFEAALERTEDPRARGRLYLDLGRALPQAGRLDEGWVATRRGMEEVGEDGSDLALELEADFLTSAIHLPELTGELRRRVDGIVASGAPLTTRASRGLASKAMIVELFAGAPRDEVLSLAHRIFGDGRLVEEDSFGSQVLPHVISTFGWCDDYAAADLALRMAFAQAERKGSAQGFASASQLRSRQRLWTGPVTDAVDDARAAVDLWRGGAEIYLHVSTYCLVVGLLERGGSDEAAAVLERTDTGGRHAGRSAWRHAARGTLAAHRGDDEIAFDAFVACGRRLEGLLVRNPVVIPWRSEAGLAAERMGRHVDARRLVAEELMLAERFGAPRALAVARQAAGLLDRGEGIGRLRQAAEELSACGAHLLQGKAVFELGAATRRAGRPREAREHLREALRLAQTTGSVALRDRAQAELRLAGGRIPLARTSDPLTPSERRVAELAAAGQSNRQIADTLFLTVKSIEWHLSNVYRKLDVNGRRGLPAALPASETEA